MRIFAHYCVNRKKKTDWKEGGKRKKKKKKRNPRILARCLSRVILRKRSIDRSIHDDVGGKVSVVFFLFFFFFLINVSAWSGERMGGHIRWIHRSSKSPTRYFLDSSSIYTRVRGNSRIDHQGRSSSSPSKSPHSLRPIFTEARTENGDDGGGKRPIDESIVKWREWMGEVNCSLIREQPRFVSPRINSNYEAKFRQLEIIGFKTDS